MAVDLKKLEELYNNTPTVQPAVTAKTEPAKQTTGVDMNKLAQLYNAAPEPIKQDRSKVAPVLPVKDNGKSAVQQQNYDRMQGLFNRTRESDAADLARVNNEILAISGYGAGADRSKLQSLFQQKDQLEQKLKTGRYDEDLTALERVQLTAQGIGESLNYTPDVLIDTATQAYRDRQANKGNTDYLQLREQQKNTDAQIALLERRAMQGVLDNAGFAQLAQLRNLKKQQESDAQQYRTPLNINSDGVQGMRRAMQAQQQATYGMSDTAAFLYNTGASIAENASLMPLAMLPGGQTAILAIMGAKSAAQKAVEVGESGGTAAEALVRGLSSGLIESATEKLPLDNLVKIAKGSTGKAIIQNVLRQAGTEGTEEAVSYIANSLVDMAALDPNAKFSIAELLMAFGGGALSGGVMGTGAEVIGRRKAGTDIDNGTKTAETVVTNTNSENKTAKNVIKNIESAIINENIDTVGAINSADNSSLQSTAKTAERAELENEMKNIFGIDDRTEVEKVVDEETSKIEALEQMRKIGVPGEDIDRAIAASEAKIEQVTTSAETTIVDDNPDTHTSDEMIDIDGYKSAINPKMLSFINKVRSLRNTDIPSKVSQTLGMVKAEEAETINKITGIDVSGFKRAAKGDRILHIDDRHGVNGEADKSLSETEDIARMEWVMDNCDDIVQVIDENGNQAYSSHFFDKENKKAPLVAYVKAINGVYYIVEAVPDSAKKTLQLESARILEKEVYQALNGKNYLSTDVQNVHGLASSKPNITQTEQNDNGNNMSKDDLPDSVGAMKSDPKKYSYMQNTFGTIEEGENPSRVVDVPVSTDGDDRVSLSARTFMEAEATPDEMIDAFEKAVAAGDFSHEINRDKESVARAVANIEKVGYSQALKSWQERIRNGKEVTKDDIVEAQIMYSVAAANGDYDLAMKLAADIGVQMTKAGQVVQSMRVLKKATPEGRLYYAQKSVQAIQNDINEKYGDNAPQIKVDNKLLDNLKNAKTEEEIAKATTELNKNIAEQLPFSWGNFFTSWRYLAMLGNPRTQMRNILSNVIGTMAQEYTYYMQAVAEAGAAKLSRKGIERTATFRKPTADQKQFAEADYQKVKDLLSGKAKYEKGSVAGIEAERNPFKITAQWGTKTEDLMVLRGIRKAADGGMKFLSMWDGVTNWAMDKGDVLFSSSAYKRYFARYMQANGWSADSMNAAKTLKARNWAMKQALESVYREENRLADAISKMERNLHNSDSVIKKAAGTVVSGIAPFKKTPLNITKRAFEYTPAGIVLELSKKDKTTPEVMNSLAKTLSGTSLMVLGYMLAKTGILSGGLGYDDEDRLKKQMGEQEYSIDGENWSYTMDWGGAAMMPLFVGAEIYNNSAEDDNVLNNLISALGTAASPIMETSMLTGFMSALKSATYADDQDFVPVFMAEALASYLNQFVPTILGQFARTVDDTSRTTYTTNTGAAKIVDKTWQKALNKIPFASKTNVPYMDMWGLPEKNTGGNVVGRLAYNMLSPGYISVGGNDKVESEIKRLYDATKDTGVIINSAPKSFDIDGEKQKLDAGKYTDYAQTRGQTAYKAAADVIANPIYAALETDEQAAAIAKAYSFAHAMGKSKVSDYEMTTREKAMSAKMDYVLGYGAATVLKNKADAMGDGNGSLKQAEAEKYLDSRDFTPEQKALLFECMCPTATTNPYK